MPSLTSSLPFSPAELAYLHTSLSSVPPLRPDARALSTDFRPLRAETGVLPAVNGSAHVGFSDGREAIVGVKLEVEKTVGAKGLEKTQQDGTMEVDADENAQKKATKGKQEWVTLTLTLPGLRDDDANLVFLEEMLREPLVVPSSSGSGATSLQNSLVINSRWHWHIYLDVLLISPNGLASYPLPLLSMATHLALRDTRVPRLKSEGEEDPIADDDWMASTYLYPRTKLSSTKPPVTLLVVVVGENVIFDPSREELAVADGVVAVSVGTVPGKDDDFQILATRMIITPARDTMKGVPVSGEVKEGADIPGVWRPRVGGIKRSVLKKAVNAVLTGGVAKDVLQGLDGFLNLETNPG
ncbi:Exosome complex component rrp42 [Cladophialophora chaetospira]|uniref:Ribosomal RNA-processing protein 42 n=1 Tax=Cladophialophora chaetospira TaxID=386627 RepID=A0AA39CEQ1_9EURO|nr:Exosome complex component rrp42 [Cladophialophora chaetospira]